jgi:hypothetical protein
MAQHVGSPRVLGGLEYLQAAGLESFADNTNIAEWVCECADASPCSPCLTCEWRRNCEAARVMWETACNANSQTKKSL